MSGRSERVKAITQTPSAETVVEQAQGIINFMQRGYAVWMAIYLMLGILTVFLPGLSAIGLFESKTNQTLAGAGALAAAIFGFLRPHEYATGFDNAAQLAWQTRNDFQLGLIDNIEVARRLGRAITSTAAQLIGTPRKRTISAGEVDHGQRHERWKAAGRRGATARVWRSVARTRWQDVATAQDGGGVAAASR